MVIKSSIALSWLESTSQRYPLSTHRAHVATTRLRSRGAGRQGRPALAADSTQHEGSQPPQTIQLAHCLWLHVTTKRLRPTNKHLQLSIATQNFKCNKYKTRVPEDTAFPTQNLLNPGFAFLNDAHRVLYGTTCVLLPPVPDERVQRMLFLLPRQRPSESLISTIVYCV